MKFRRNPCTYTGSITVENRCIDYAVVESSRARYARITVSLKEGLVVTVPSKYHRFQVEQLLLEKAPWITAKIDRVREMAELEKQARENSSKVLRYLGKEYAIVIVLDATSPVSVVLDREKAYITMPEDNQALLTNIIQAWLHWAAKEYIPARVKTLATTMGVKYQKVFIKNQRSRWGSCSKEKNLNFNMRLMMAPPEIVDYVIIHELAHLVELNHSKAFWALVAHYCPYYRDAIGWLKNNGTGLVI